MSETQIDWNHFSVCTLRKNSAVIGHKIVLTFLPYVVTCHQIDGSLAASWQCWSFGSAVSSTSQLLHPSQEQLVD